MAELLDRDRDASVLGDRMSPRRPVRARVAARAGTVSRWGLLLTALALLAALLGTGLSAYLAVESSTLPIVRLLGRELVSSARHSLHVAGALTPEVMQEVLAEFGSRGRALCRGDGHRRRRHRLRRGAGRSLFMVAACRWRRPAAPAGPPGAGPSDRAVRRAGPRCRMA